MLAVFCKCTGRRGFMLQVPVLFLLVCTFTSLVQSLIGCASALAAGTAANVFNSVLQLIFAVLLVVLGLIVAYHCIAELKHKKRGSIPDEEPEWTELGREHCAESDVEAERVAAAAAVSVDQQQE